LKVRSRCGCSLCLRQMRCTEPTEMPMALAIARPVQWVVWCGGSAQVSATSYPHSHRFKLRAVIFAPLDSFVCQTVIIGDPIRHLVPCGFGWDAGFP
jgi:hypothetical protein